MKKKYMFATILLIVIVLFFGYLWRRNSGASLIGNNTSVIDTNINTDDDDQKIEWSNYENREVLLKDSITITESGVYHLTGTIEDGMITINTTGNVKVNLDNVTITNSNGPAIYVKEAEDVVININGINSLTDSSNYTGYEEEVNGVIYSADDITFDGDGTLVISANYQDGIVGKDDLKIIGGTYDITSVDDGIRGKDSVYILNGTFKIEAGGDAIKSTNDTDSQKGYILIENGTFALKSELDGLQAQTKLVISNGSFDIISGGGSDNSSYQNDQWGHWGGDTSSEESAKGLKSGDNLVIEKGIFVLNTSDDAIHSNNYVGIKGGTIKITSGDDGIHADTELIIDGGTIEITKSYEGLESAKMTINGGDISVVSSDDGINIAGGNDGSAMGRPGANKYNSNSENMLTINAGKIYVNASGDGIDVNGSAYMYGGTVLVDGPTNNGNGALDYDYVFEVNGGTFVAGGASGMAQTLSSSSKIYNVFVQFNTTLSGDDIIIVVDENDKQLLKYQSDKNYNSLLFALSELKKGKKYTIKVNDKVYDSFTVTDVTTTIGNFFGGEGFHGGRR